MICLVFGSYVGMARIKLWVGASGLSDFLSKTVAIHRFVGGTIFECILDVAGGG